MKTSIIRGATLLAGVCLTVAVLFTGAALQPATPTQNVSFSQYLSDVHVPSTQGDGSQLFGRKEYEWLRLMDPSIGQIPRGILTASQEYARTLPVRGRTNNKYESQISTQDWSFRGPNNVGGRTRALAVDVSNGDRILAGGVTGGMWLSEDGGATWQRTTALEDGPGATCVAQDRRDGHTDTWYYGSGEYTGSGSRSINSRIPVWRGDGMFKSVDGGFTWTQLEATASSDANVDSPFDVIFRIATNPANTEQDEVFAACYGTIQRSQDGGETWETVLGTFDTDLVSWTDVAVTPSGIVYATLATDLPGGIIHRSTDNGETWQDITPDGWPGTSWRTVMDIAPSNEDLMIFLAHTPGSGFQDMSLYKLNILAGIDIFENLSSNLPNFGNQGIYGQTINPQGGYNMVVRFHPENTDVIYAAGTSLFRCLDGFNSRDEQQWIGGYNYYYDLLPPPQGGTTSFPNHHADVHNLVFDPNDPEVMFCSHDGGLSRSDDPLFIQDDQTPFPWDYMEGYHTTQFYWVSVDPVDDVQQRIIGGMQDNGTWMTGDVDPLADWFEMLGGDGMACAIGDGSAPGNRSYYCSTQYGGGPYRIELDENYQFVGWGWAAPPAAMDRWITPFHLDPTNWRAFYVVATREIWANPDVVRDEDDWTMLASSGANNLWTTGMGVSQEDHTVYYGVYDNNRSQHSEVHRIDNALSENPTVTDVSTDQFPVGGWIHCITVDPTDAMRALVVFTNFGIPSLFYTEDGGENWTDVGGNLEEFPDGSGVGPSCFWAEIAYINDNPFYLVGTTTGLYSTRELEGAETEWALEGPEVLGQQWVTHIDIRHTDGFVAIGTHGAGTYSAFLEETSVEEQPDGDLVPSSYTMQSAYPNPFNPATTVPVVLPATTELRLTVYNNLGQQVAVLADGRFSAGQHHFRFDGTNLASGTYYIQATVAGSAASTQRVVLMK